MNTGTQTQTHLREGILFISWPGSGLKPARAQLITTRGNTRRRQRRRGRQRRRQRQRRPSRAVPHHTQSSPHTVDRVWSWGPPHNSYVLCHTPNCQNYTDVRCETRPGGPLTPQILSLFLRRPLCGWLTSLSGGLSALCPLRCQSLVGGRPVTHYGSKLLPVVATVDPRLSDSGPGTIKLRYRASSGASLDSSASLTLSFCKGSARSSRCCR